ncbi:T9SS type A sorting domain-containing protein [Hymenobacter sp. ASUV-10]|uniref:T9SS type A sorting domain-containing protein n=1 Tax=Hymenobacter aranciens TaxID=3063996 RepID=A0ABT9BKA9_9BACT|nr:T9SS type A sorting domain-containing protein [Hymenobacter sp. ASUV-10]MDO7876973.1 T9SS type A sorting domain-containing protein [Hymenobacter sp. ASUV-10]
MFNLSSFPFPAALVRVLLALLFAAGSLPSVAQTPAWQSAQAMASLEYGSVQATAVDAAGNVYLAGGFSVNIMVGNIMLTSHGNQDAFVAKFNLASNQFMWVQQVGGIGDDYIEALAVSGTSVYVAGSFRGSVSFGATTLSNMGYYSDVFVTKLTDAGSFVWAQQAGGTSHDNARALAVSGSSVYVAGAFFSPTASFGATTLTNTDATAPTSDVFVAKLTDVGSTSNFVWAQQAGGSNYDQVIGLAVSGSSVYVAGDFYSPTASFGDTTLTNTDATAATSDVFVAKLTDAGSTSNFVWAQQAGGMGYDGASELAVSGTSVYAAGAFSSPTASFGAATLTNTGLYDMFVTKLTDAGSTSNFVWAQQAGGAGRDQVMALAVSSTNVYVAGAFSSPTASFGAATLTNTGLYDMFVTKLTDAGSTSNFVWAQQVGGIGNDYAEALAVSGTSVYVAGSFSSRTISFGTNTLTNPSGIANSVGFLASLTDPTLTATTSPRTALAQLYPNPAHSTTALRLPAGLAPTPLTLCDAQGRAVRRYPAPATLETTLDLHGLPVGLYILQGGSFSQRLAIE